MPKFLLYKGDADTPFLSMEAEAANKPADPNTIQKEGDGVVATDYAVRLAKSKFQASPSAIASRMGRDVRVEEEGAADLQKALDEANAKIGKDQEFDLGASGEIVKTDPAQQIVFGWAYVTHDHEGNLNVDKSGDFADDIYDVEKTAYDFVLKSRNGDADHTNVKGSTMVESIIFTPEKIEKMGLPEGSVPLGWWVGFKVEDAAVWDRVVKGELTAFSIHGTGTRAKVSED